MKKGGCWACFERVEFGDREKGTGRVQCGDTEEMKEGCSLGTQRKKT